ncbi:MAG: Smr/MutS family protein [Rhodospirillales bacterium]|nr:Smr/MutS family protein [Rhodospirillales bacterium]
MGRKSKKGPAADDDATAGFIVPRAVRRRALRHEELVLWKAVAETIEPLPGRSVTQPDEEPATPGDARPKPSFLAVPPAPPASMPTRTDLPELSHGVTAGVDKRTAQRLRRGQLPIDARIDLHGHFRDAAHTELNAFIARAHEAGRRCVLVITGKGTRGEGVLRAQVPHWLNMPPNRARVVAFCHAQPKDGGEGALYVLIRRKR